MKRLATIAALALCIGLSASAKDTYARSASVLPRAAQTVLSSNFKAKVSVVKIEKNMGGISEYEVVLTDGTEISFDRGGNWDNIETAANKAVPSALVPASISSYVSKNQRGAKIIGIDRDRHGYEVELSNGVEMKFDRSGNFIRYDH